LRHTVPATKNSAGLVWNLGLIYVSPLFKGHLKFQTAFWFFGYNIVFICYPSGSDSPTRKGFI
ncbi:hypothetical protein, partial [Neisseria sp. P0004.S002]|uniref:hypothetical protein n=1 Tax=unclassified Neisseria TaxID=2623750 RepID=UPI003F821DFF